MSDFRVKTQILDVVRFLGSIMSVAYIVLIFLVILFSTTHYTYITNTSPPSILYPPLGIPDFRPASNVPQLAAQSPIYQEQALYFGFWFILIESNALRIIFPLLWFFSLQYIKKSSFFFLPGIIFVIGGVVEVIRLFIFLIERLTPSLYFIVTYPNVATVSNEFLWLIWSSLLTIIYLVILTIFVIIIMWQSKEALEEERQEFIETQMNSSINVKRERTSVY